MDTETVNTVADRIGDAVSALAQQLQVPAERLLDAGMRYVMVKNIGDLIVMLIVGCISMLLIKKVFVTLKELSDDNLTYTQKDILGGFFSFYLITGCICSIVTGVYIIDLPSTLGNIFAPEIGLIEIIANMFKGN